MSEFRGACLCGGVTFRVARGPVQVVACHCRLCRRMTGAAFSSYAAVRSRDLEIEDAQGILKRHPVSERTERAFCCLCGTPILNRNPTTYPGLTMLYLGSIDEPNDFRPAIQIFCESKLAWVPASGMGTEFERATQGA